MRIYLKKNRIPKFSPLLKDISDFCLKNDIAHPLQQEIETRIKQLDFLRSRIYFYERKHLKDNGAKFKEIFLKLQTYTESYYLFAFIIFDIIRENTNFLKKNKMGIMLVRNHLIQHRNKECNATFSQSWSSDKGMALRQQKVIKAGGKIVAEPPKKDPGIYENSAEFYEALKKLLCKP